MASLKRERDRERLHVGEKKYIDILSISVSCQTSPSCAGRHSTPQISLVLLSWLHVQQLATSPQISDI